MTEKMESIDNKTCPKMKGIKDINMGFYKTPKFENQNAPDLGYQTGLEFSKTPK